MKESLCIIIAIERGILEKYSLLLLRSLRMFGGSFANVPVFAYQPRKHFKISNRTKKELKKLDVILIDEVLNKKYKYYALANKPIVCAHAEENLAYNQIVFLDSDTLVLNEPKALLLGKGYDVGLAPVYSKGIGIFDEKDDNFDYWSSLFNIIGSNINGQPTISTLLDDEKILGYWNSAVITSKKSSGLYCKWRDNLFKVLDVGLKPKSSIYFVEESTVSATILAEKSNIFSLPVSHNFPLIKETFSNVNLKKHLDNPICIVHQLDEMELLQHFLDQILDQTIAKEKVQWLKGQIKELGLAPKRISTMYYKRINLIRRALIERGGYLLQKHITGNE